MIVASMAAFGTLAPFVRSISVTSGELALYRAILASLLIGSYLLFTKQPIAFDKIKKELPLLLFSGAAMGLNWILLFEAYRYTSVATATLCYYMAPIFVIAASPIVLRERLTLRRGVCIVVALVGMVAVSGVPEGAGGDFRGILLGLGAALLYASVILMNKRMGEISAYDKTTVQLASAAVVILPYVLLAEQIPWEAFTLTTVLVLLVVGVLHTGIAYVLYFGSMYALKAQSVALLSYLDPIIAIVLSALLLQEWPSLLVWIGAVLVLGAAMVSELPSRKKGEVTESLS
jgi:drug/metabolite transporter (DMT)-like permease